MEFGFKQILYAVNSVNVNHDWLSGNDGLGFCHDLRTFRCQTSHIRWNFRRKLLGGRCVLIRAAGLSCAELGPSSAHRQSFRSTDFTTVLVKYKFTYIMYCIVLELSILLLISQVSSKMCQ